MNVINQCMIKINFSSFITSVILSINSYTQTTLSSLKRKQHQLGRESHLPDMVDHYYTICSHTRQHQGGRSLYWSVFWRWENMHCCRRFSLIQVSNHLLHQIYIATENKYRINMPHLSQIHLKNIARMCLDHLIFLCIPAKSQS